MLTRKVRLLGRDIQMVGSEIDSEIVQWPNGGDRTEPAMLRVSSLIPSDAVCLDVGANLGLYAIALATIAPDGHVYAFEPVPDTAEYLRRNTSSAADNVTVIEAACGDHEGTITMQFTEGFSSGSFETVEVYEDAQSIDSKPVQVAATTIDRFVADTAIDRVDLIKIDVEGGELGVLRGGRKVLSEFRPLGILEFNHLALTLHQRLLPQEVLREIRDSFPFVYVFDRSSGELQPIRTERDVYRFLWYNGVYGPVDNLLGSFHDVVPDAPGFDETWLKAEALRWNQSPGEQTAAPASPLEGRAHDAERELQAMRGTVSWRVTRPLRLARPYIMKAADKLRR